MEEFGLRTARDALAALKNKVWSTKHDLSTSERAVLEALIHFADENGETFVGVATTAARTHRSVGTVRRCIDALRARGVVATTIEHTSRGRRLRYSLHLDALGPSRAPAQNDRTRSIKMIRSPQGSPSSDRIKFNDPPLSPPEGAGRSVDSSEETIVTHVVELFATVLWPDARGPALTRQRCRLVRKRLRELRTSNSAEVAEEILSDAIHGARLHPWHRSAELGRHARIVFRDLDKLEELAALGKRERLALANRHHETPLRTAPVPSLEETNEARREGARALSALLSEWEDPVPTTSPSVARSLTNAELALLVKAHDRARTRVA